VHHRWRSLASFRSAASLFQVSPIPKIRIIPGTVGLDSWPCPELSLSLCGKSSASLPCTLHLPGEVTVASLNQNTPDGFFFHKYCLQNFTNGLPVMEANMAVQTQLPIMVRKSLWPTLAQNGMYLKDIAGDGVQPQSELWLRTYADQNR
jgi:hypothetical protein